MESWMLGTWWMLLKMILIKKITYGLCFCVNLRYKTQYSICKCTAQPEKGGNRNNLVRKNQCFWNSPARTGSSSKTCVFFKFCLQEHVKTTTARLKMCFDSANKTLHADFIQNNISVHLDKIQYRKCSQKFTKWLWVLWKLTQWKPYFT